MPPSGSILTGRFLLSLNAASTTNPVYKSRLVVPGTTINISKLLCNIPCTARCPPTWMLMSVAAMQRYRLCSFDDTQAHLQSNAELTRTVYICPPRYLANPELHLLRLSKALYTISFAHDYWHGTVTSTLRKYVGLTSSTGYHALYHGRHHAFRTMEGKVDCEVDDVLGTVSIEFQTRTLHFEGPVDSNPRESSPLTFPGFPISPPFDT